MRRALFVGLVVALAAGGSQARRATDPCGFNPQSTRLRPASWADDTHAEQQEAERFGYARKVTGREQSHYVAFTFDDGPDADITPRIMDALEEYGVPATFFAVGWRFDGNSDRDLRNAATLRDVARRGFSVGNHTFNHHNLREMPRAQMQQEIRHTQHLIEREIGYRPYLFRAPFGALGRAARTYLSDLGYTEVRWNIDVGDWKRSRAKKVRQAVFDSLIAKAGGILLLHDTKTWTADELPGILDDLEAENCRRRTADEPLLVPVSLDFFIYEKTGHPRAIPRFATTAADAYVAALTNRCAIRTGRRPTPHADGEVSLDLAPVEN